MLSYSIHFLCRNYNSKSWSPKTTVTSWVWSWADQSPTRITRLWPAGATLSKSSRRAGDWEAKPSASQSIWRSSHGLWRLDKCEQFRFVPKHFATRLVHCFSECFVCFHCSWKLPAYPSPKPMLLGTLRSDDGDGGANVKKQFIFLFTTKRREWVCSSNCGAWVFNARPNNIQSSHHN